ncbi:UNVERIFIED_CONTAM: Alpha-N-acetylglucosaminidase, partial [Sesamum angustifolium]
IHSMRTPPTSDPTYISSLGSAVYKAMSTVDKDAVWLMQGWLFYSDSVFWKPPQMKALLHSVPFGKMIVLDLFADVKPIWKSSSQFYDTPYIWCMLHNFGGNIEMYGILDAVASGPIDARVSKNSTMIGVGMCMEGIEHNPIVYELMSEMAFRSDPLQLEEWLTTYSLRRYGKSVQQVEAAWKILHHTIYNCTDGIADHNTDYIVKFPDWDPSVNNQHARSEIIQRHKLAGIQQQRRFFLRETSSTLPRPHLWYNIQDAVSALKLFLDAGDELAEIPTYRYDLVDLTRQSLSKLANEVYLNAIHAFRDKDPKALSFHSLKFLQLTKDIDTLLAADDNFLLGTWLESAKKLSVNAEETKQYEWNARTQVTMWYDNTKYVQSKLHDYETHSRNRQEVEKSAEYWKPIQEIDKKWKNLPKEIFRNLFGKEISFPHDKDVESDDDAALHWLVNVHDDFLEMIDLSLDQCKRLRKKEKQSGGRTMKIDDDQENGFQMVYEKRHKKLLGGSEPKRFKN